MFLPEGAMQTNTRYSLADHKVDSVLEILRSRSRGILLPENGSLLKDVLDDLANAMEELRAAHAEVDAQREELDRACQDARREHQRYAELFEDAPDGYVVTDVNGVIRQANRAALELLESAGDSVLERPLALYVNEDDKPAYFKRLNEIDAPETVTDWELRFQSWKGKPFWASVSIAKVQIPEHEDISLRWLIRDISSRKQTEEVLRRYALLASHSRDIILFMRREDGRILEANAAAVKAYGYSHEEFLTLTIHDLRAHDTRMLTLEQMAQAERGGTLFETFHRRKDGSVFPVEVSSLGETIGGVRTLISVIRDMTQRKQADKELRENQSRLDLALRSSDMGVWRWDIVENRRRFDDRVCHLLGINPVEFTGTEDEFFNIVHPDDRQAIREALARAVERDGPYETEYRVVHPDGGIHHIAARGKLVHDDNGRPAKLNGIIWDITERKRLEEKAAHLAAIVESSDDAIISKTLSGEIISWNRAAEEIYGYSAEELIGRSISILVPEGVPDDLPAILEKLSRSEKIDHYETRRRRKNGEVIPVSLSISPIRDRSGQIIGASTIPRDITEDKRIEEELCRSRDELKLRVEDGTAQLCKSEERIRAAFDLSAVGQAEFDIRTNRFQRVNQRFCEITGYSCEELLNRHFGDITHPEDRAEDLAKFAEMLRGEKREHFNRKRYICKDGSIKWVEVHATLLRDEDGVPVSSVGVITDVTGKKEAEDRITSYAKKLEHLNQELQEFVFVASHDLQEPLRKIQTFCDMTQKRSARVLDTTSQEYLDRVRKSANRMRQLLRDLLEFSMVATRRESLKRMDLTKIAREAAEVFDATLDQSGGLVEIETLPSIVADKSQMLRLFQNLIGNALKYRSGENPRIVISAKPSRDGICEIFVKDNGIGFDQEFAEIIFRPFQRLHKSGEYEGAGIGLTICRKIVERHGGGIRAESVPGRGSTFIVSLPVKPGELVGQAAARKGQTTILMADDDADDCFLATRAFAEIDAQGAVTCVMDGVELMSRLTEISRSDPGELPKLILLDLNMPRKDGRQTLTEIKAQPDLQNIPVIMLSTSRNAKDVDFTTNAGAKLFITKPETFEEWIEMMKFLAERWLRQLGEE
jgi:PAS domain S-box-containing protein